MGALNNAGAQAVKGGRHAEPVYFRSEEPEAQSFKSWTDYERARGRTLAQVVSRRDSAIGFSGGIPWPTFVLGSGCLRPLPGTEIAAPELRSLIQDGVANLPSERRQPGDLDLVEQFIHALIALKLEDSIGQTGWLLTRSRDSGAFSWPVAVQVCLLAAIATRAYTNLRSASAPVLGRSDREEVVFSQHETSEMTLAYSRYVVPMDNIAEYLMGRDIEARGEAWRSFKTLLQTIGARGDDGRRHFRRQHVELLAAFAWHFLTDGTEIYPGWSDILLFHTFDLASHEFERWPATHRPPKTSSALDVDSWVYRRLEKVTERSVRTPEPFFGLVADILEKQSEVLGRLYAAWPESERIPSHIPRATAFVTSFDLELEIALLDRAAVFAIVAPVVGTRPHTTSALNASLHWVYRVIRPNADETISDRLQRLRQGDDWKLMPESTDLLPVEIDRIPVVVHLAGAPLLALPMELPGLRTPSHALLLDETIAVLQFGAEVRGTGSDRLNRRLLSSPKDKGAGAEPAPRFWTFVGNPHADPAVRLRLLANGWHSSVDAQGQGSDPSESAADAPRQAGVVINRWVPIEESEVFRWQGFDVVAGETTDLLAGMSTFSATAYTDYLAADSGMSVD